MERIKTKTIKNKFFNEKQHISDGTNKFYYTTQLLAECRGLENGPFPQEILHDCLSNCETVTVDTKVHRCQQQ